MLEILAETARQNMLAAREQGHPGRPYRATIDLAFTFPAAPGTRQAEASADEEAEAFRSAVEAFMALSPFVNGAYEYDLQVDVQVGEVGQDL